MAESPADWSRTGSHGVQASAGTSIAQWLPGLCRDTRRKQPDGDNAPLPNRCLCAVPVFRVTGAMSVPESMWKLRFRSISTSGSRLPVLEPRGNHIPRMLCDWPITFQGQDFCQDRPPSRLGALHSLRSSAARADTVLCSLQAAISLDFGLITHKDISTTTSETKLACAFHRKPLHLTRRTIPCVNAVSASLGLDNAAKKARCAHARSLFARGAHASPCDTVKHVRFRRCVT